MITRIKQSILALLLLFMAAAQGAWAEDTYTVTFKANGNTKTVENVALPRTFSCDWKNANGELDQILKELYGWTGDANVTYCDNSNEPTSSDATKVEVGLDNSKQYITISSAFDGTVTVTGQYCVQEKLTEYSLEISCTAEESDDIDLSWDYSTNKGQFKMPNSDVEVNLIYAPTAQFAIDADQNPLAPTAAENIEIASTDSIITPGTVATIGESTTAQGTVMYAISQSNEAAPTSGYSATLPTAKDITAAGTYYVWYYIEGQDTPEGETPTAQNTFNNSDTLYVAVTLLTNEHTLYIEQNKNITLTVAGTKQTISDDGTVAPVKTGQEVKLKANEGYKFRKVEAKKKAPAAEGKPLAEATVGMLVASDGKAYAAADKDNLPTGVTAAGVVAVKSATEGQSWVISLKDATSKSWNALNGENFVYSTGIESVSGHTWKVGSKEDYTTVYTSPYSTVQGYISAAGGTQLSGYYWSSTELGSSSGAWYFSSDGNWGSINKGSKGNVRPIFAF